MPLFQIFLSKQQKPVSPLPKTHLFKLKSLTYLESHLLDWTLWGFISSTDKVSKQLCLTKEEVKSLLFIVSLKNKSLFVDNLKYFQEENVANERVSCTIDRGNYDLELS